MLDSQFDRPLFLPTGSSKNKLDNSLYPNHDHLSQHSTSSPISTPERAQSFSRFCSRPLRWCLPLLAVARWLLGCPRIIRVGCSGVSYRGIPGNKCLSYRLFFVARCGLFLNKKADNCCIVSLFVFIFLDTVKRKLNF